MVQNSPYSRNETISNISMNFYIYNQIDPPSIYTYNQIWPCIYKVYNQIMSSQIKGNKCHKIDHYKFKLSHKIKATNVIRWSLQIQTKSQNKGNKSS
jgi:hypothetical protein